jgi:hypothetical protein
MAQIKAGRARQVGRVKYGRQGKAGRQVVRMAEAGR